MAKGNPQTVIDNMRDTFCDFHDSGSLVSTNPLPGVQGGWIDNSINFPSRTDLVIPEDGNVHVGDFVMSGKEFKTCMKMLHKMAMKECPEEFI